MQHALLSALGTIPGFMTMTAGAAELFSHREVCSRDNGEPVAAVDSPCHGCTPFNSPHVLPLQHHMAFCWLRTQ